MIVLRGNENVQLIVFNFQNKTHGIKQLNHIGRYVLLEQLININNFKLSNSLRLQANLTCFFKKFEYF